MTIVFILQLHIYIYKTALKFLLFSEKEIRNFQQKSKFCTIPS